MPITTNECWSNGGSLDTEREMRVPSKEERNAYSVIDHLLPLSAFLRDSLSMNLKYQ